MKKIVSFVCVGLFGLAAQATLASGIFDSFVVLNLNGGGNTYYDLDSTTGNPDFGGANLGVFDPSTDNLNISGGQIKTFEDPNTVDDATGAAIRWAIYKQGDPQPALGSFFGHSLVQQGAQVGNDRTWEDLAHSFNEISILSPGLYNLAVMGRGYFHFDDGQGNSGNFEVDTQVHVATFEVVPEPTSAVLVGLGIAGAAALLRRKA